MNDIRHLSACSDNPRSSCSCIWVKCELLADRIGDKRRVRRRVVHKRDACIYMWGRTLGGRECSRERRWRERSRRSGGKWRRSWGGNRGTWVDGGGALGGRRKGGIGRVVLRKDVLDVIQGVGDNKLEGSEGRERRHRGCHGRCCVTTARGEGRAVTIRKGRSL